MKKCVNCRKLLSLKDFYKNRTRKDGLTNQCKTCQKIIHSSPEARKYQKEHYLKNKSKIQEQRRKYYQTSVGKQKMALKRKKYKDLNPWYKTLMNIKDRCNNPKNDSYKWYGAKNIECLITSKELKELWFRDKAEFMKQHSIDRINSKDHYTKQNCRYIELSKNVRRARKKVK